MSKPTLLIPGNLYQHGVQIKTKLSPLDYVIQWIRSQMVEFGHKSPHRVIILKAETGSGKSTAFPVALMRILRSMETNRNTVYTKASIICTQPKILTAIEIVRDICSQKYNPDMVLGQTIGYQTGPYTEAPRAGLLFTTVGVLLVQLRTMTDEDIMHRYKFILIDEAHERSLDIDLTLMLLQQFYQRNKGNHKLPFLFLLSATLDVNIYMNYFQTNISFEVKGLSYPIEVRYLDVGSNDVIKSAIETITDIHTKIGIDDEMYKSDIIVFMPGELEATNVQKALIGKFNNVMILIINSKIVNSKGRDFMMINVPTKQRKIIIATTVAETGLTIESLKYVIDSGWNRSKETYFPEAISSLVTKPAPKSRVLQRKGRCGRKFPGIFYPLYTENVFKSLDEIQKPEIIIAGCHQIIMAICISLEPVFDFSKLNMLTTPPSSSLSWSLQTLNYLGVIEIDKFTNYGNIIKKAVRVQPEAMRLIMMAYVFNVSIHHTITLAALMGITSTDICKDISGLCKWLKIEEIEDTFIIFLHFFNHIIDNGFDGIPENVKLNGCYEVLKAREDIVCDLLYAGLNVLAEPYIPTFDYLAVQHCLFDALRMRLIIDGKSITGLTIKNMPQGTFVTDQFLFMNGAIKCGLISKVPFCFY